MSCFEKLDHIDGDNKSNKLLNAVKRAASQLNTSDINVASITKSKEFVTDVLTLAKENGRAETDIFSLPHNTLVKLIKYLYKKKVTNIDTTIKRTFAARLDGFSSSSAKQEGIRYLAFLLNNGLYKRNIGENQDILNLTQLISEVINEEFAEVKKEIIEAELNKNGQLRFTAEGIAFDDYNSQYIELSQELKSISDEIKSLNDEANAIELQSEKRKFIKENEEKLANLNKFANDKRKQINDVKKLLWGAMQNLRAKHLKDNIQYQNRFNLLDKLLGADLKYYISLARESDMMIATKELITDDVDYGRVEDGMAFSEEEDGNFNHNEYEGQTKSWEDSLHKSFDRTVGSDVKKYLAANIFKLSSPLRGSKDEVPAYDKSKYLGVRETIPVQYTIAQIMSHADTMSPKRFLQSIERAANDVPALHGLSILVRDMKASPEFLNRIWFEMHSEVAVKNMIRLRENDINIGQSNRKSNPITALVNSMINNVHSTFLANNIEKSQSLIKNLRSKLLSSGSTINDKTLMYIDNELETLINKYFPDIDIISIKQYLKSNNTTDKEKINKYVKLLGHLHAILNALNIYKENYLEAKFEDAKARKKYNSDKEAAANGDTSVKVVEPVYKLNNINDNELRNLIYDFAEDIKDYFATDVELNSSNAEHNLASDLLNNNFIFQQLNQITYGTDEDAQLGLKKLRDYVSRGEDYKYSTLFFGVDNEGGLFKRAIDGSVVINESIDYKKYIKASLFNGISDDVLGNAIMFDRMTKSDYFLTNVLMFAKSNTYFTKIPSDAPKIFSIEREGYSYDEMYSLAPEAATIIEQASKAYYEGTKIVGQNLDTNYDVELDTKSSNALRLTPDTFKEIIKNSDNFAYNRKDTVKDGKVYINRLLSIRDKKTDRLYYIEFVGDVSDTNSKYAKNIKIASVTETTSNHLIQMPELITNLIEEAVTLKLDKEKKLPYSIHRNSKMFRAFRQELIGELNKFVDALNDVFIIKDGELISREDTNGLFKHAHFKDTIVKDGQLTGNFFKFVKLFKIGNYDVNEEMYKLLSLYGVANSVFKVKENRLVLQIENAKWIDNSGNDLKLNPAVIDNLNLDDIVEQWIVNYSYEVKDNCEQYRELINSINDNYSVEENDEIKELVTDNIIMGMMFNGVLMNYGLDDLFDGNSKFYKDPQTILKRMKESQAGGKSYSGHDINDRYMESLHNITGIDDKTELKIKINDKQLIDGTGKPMFARNGFRAVTVKNVRRPSEMAEEIAMEITEILIIEKGMDDHLAEEIGKKIADGYTESTAVNDAQSYITFDEFIRRRFADGTINQYTDLIEELFVKKTPVNKLDLAKINARIQVQKNFYYDIAYDEDTRCHYPRQIKNAEFVLIPQLLEGTDLRELYDFMIANDIGQINTDETSKAANRESLTLWENDGTFKLEEFSQQVKNNPKVIENYYYRYLYKQQDVVDHIKDKKNKVGIQIVKKLIDNADDSVQEYINTFFKFYGANIYEDYRDLLDRMGWKINDKGQLVNKNGEDATFKELYDLAKEQAVSLGLSSNFLEYLTVDKDTPHPIMPNCMNAYSSKLENIAQAIFNSSITRQEFPGWHAAQVSAVGATNKILSADGKTLISKKLHYHPLEDGKRQAYMEIMLPKNSKWLSGVKLDKKEVDDEYNLLFDEAKKLNIVVINKDELKKQAESLVSKDKVDAEYERLLKEAEEKAIESINKDALRGKARDNVLIKKLKDGKLDIHLGYRMPTEGKQSVSILKVVGLVNECYGSTVFVPDEWVTQTGSDFDVDTIYAMSYEMTRGLKKITYNGIEDEINTRKRYRQYVYKKLRSKTDKEELDDTIKEINESYSRTAETLRKNEYSMLSEVGNEYFDYIAKRLDIKVSITRKGKTQEYSLVRALKKYQKDVKESAINNYAERLNKEIEFINNEILPQITDEKVKDYLTKYVDARNKLYNYVLDPDVAIKDSKYDIGKDDEIFKEYEKQAKKAGLVSYEEFSKWSVELQNSREARNNVILDSLIAIMNNSNSREENYSRSNFERLTEAKEIIDALRGENVKNNSPYNPINQMENMESASAGRTLKAFSVSRDTFNSICNYTKARLNNDNAIFVKYDLSKYNKEIIEEAYRESEDPQSLYYLDADGRITKDSEIAKYAVVKHRRIGHSLNNRNVEGMLITPYSAQTTAHILDVMKAGSIYNENNFTFGTFKTLLDVGIDFETAIAFLQQPAVSMVVKAYNAKESVYNKDNSNPIDMAFREWANKMGILVDGKQIDKYTPMTKVEKAILNDYRVKEYFKNYPGKELYDKLSIIDAETLKNRIKKETNGISDDLFDLSMLINFKKYYVTTQQLENIMRCTNPDKFGAKQTVVETREKLENIDKYYENPTILCDAGTLLQNIYPNFDINTGCNESESKYPYMASFINYATVLSVKANKQLLITESEAFVSLLDLISAKLGLKLRGENYLKAKKYIVSAAYESIPFLYTPVTLDNNGLIIPDADRYEGVKDILSKNAQYFKVEKLRISGVEEIVRGDIEIKDVKNPTAEEIKQFNLLTPAQKVIWIKQNYKDGTGIFENIKVDLFSSRDFAAKGYSIPKIKFSESAADIEDLLTEFNESFFNSDPLLRLTAIDLIKYAFVVDGFNFKVGSISKLITNVSMYSPLTSKGCDIITDFVSNLSDMCIDNEQRQNISDDFIRSNPQLVTELKLDIPTYDKSNQPTNLAAIYLTTRVASEKSGEYGMIKIPNKLLDEILYKLRISTKEEDTQYEKLNKVDGKFIKISAKINKYKRNQPILYKIVNGYLIPQNELEQNEHGAWSYNNSKNKYFNLEKYMDKITYINDENKENLIEPIFDKEEKATFRQVRKIIKNKDENILDSHLHSSNNEVRTNANTLVENIRPIFTSTSKSMIVSSYYRQMDDFVKEGIPQKIEVNGEEKVVLIKKLKPSKPFYKLYLSGNPAKDTDNVSSAEREYLSFANSSNLPHVRSMEQIGMLYYVEDITDYSDVYESSIELEDYEEESQEVETYDPISKTARAAYKDIRYRKERMEDREANRFLDAMDARHINFNDLDSIKTHKRNIYETAATYYENRGRMLLHQIDNFELSNGEVVSLKDDDFYEKVSKTPEDIELLLRFLLEARNFGGRLGDVFKLGIEGEDMDTQRAITKMRNIFAQLRNNTIIHQTSRDYFKKYLSEQISNNPEVKEGLVELTTIFGDTDWFDLHFSDIGELNHKQIQTVVKLVYSMVNKAKMFDAPKNVDDFTRKFDEIEKQHGKVNLDKLITKGGEFIPIHTAKFEEDRRRYIDELEAIEKRTGSTTSLEYLKKDLEFKKWKARNLQQKLINSYYIASNEAEEKVLTAAGQLYADYQTLAKELRTGSSEAELPLTACSDEEKARRRNIKLKQQELLDDINPYTGEVKSEYEREKIDAIKQYFKKRKEINDQYYVNNPIESFKQNLKYYLDRMKEYNKKHPNEILYQKLEDEGYREAYDWIKTNAIYRLNESARTKIDDALKILSSNNTSVFKFISNLEKKKNLYNEYGDIDPLKFSKEDIAEIKKMAMFKYYGSDTSISNYDNPYSDKQLIRNTNAEDSAVFTNEFWLEIASDAEKEGPTIKKKRKLIARANELLKRCLDDNNKINSTTMFANLSNLEIQELADIYEELRKIKSGRSKENLKKFREHVEFKTNDADFEIERGRFTAIKDRNKMRIWTRIFMEENEEGDLVANSQIYGYIVPKDDKYVDKQKTNAKNFLDKNVIYEETDLYYAEARKAQNEGRYKEWYDENHVYNPYSQRWEPLSIWTRLAVNPNGELDGQYVYEPTYENIDGMAKDGTPMDGKNPNLFDAVNHEYSIYTDNYNSETGDYNSNHHLSTGEQKMLTHLKATMIKYIHSHKGKHFMGQNFAPRRARVNTDTNWYMSQVLGAMGLEFRHTGEQEYQRDMDYLHDREIEFNMLEQLRRKGMQDFKPYPPKTENQTDEEYKAIKKSIDEENKKIKEENSKLEQEILDNDWKSVFQDFVQNATIINAKERAKLPLYLLLQDIQENGALEIKPNYGGVRKNNNLSIEGHNVYHETAQENTQKLLQTFMRRFLFDQFKKPNKLNDAATMLQQMTSAKYMIFNVTGGIANVRTGKANIFGEIFGKEWFGYKQYTNARIKYFANIFNILNDAYKEKSDNKVSALIKFFDVVDYDQILERRPNENASEYARRTNDFLYSMQTSGEHYMQNTVMLAMLESHKVYRDSSGKLVIGTINDYTRQIEYDALRLTVEENETLKTRLIDEYNEIKNDVSKQLVYDRYQSNFATNFVKKYLTKDMQEKFIATRKRLMKDSEKKFNSSFKSIESYLEVKDGRIVLNNEFEGEDRKTMESNVATLKQKIVSVNKKIHGVYDKIGAAKIEEEFFGGLVMQYHKHIYPGFMKRYRRKGYYNEIRDDIEKGSYTSFIQTMFSEFAGSTDKIKDRIKAGDNAAVATLGTYFRAAVDCVLNMRMNYRLAPLWEQRNMKRALGDLYGCASAFLFAMCIYAAWDDDEIKESETLSTAIYIADRMFAESRMYFPLGTYAEAKTLYSSPIAVQNTPVDLLKTLEFTAQWLMDDDYNPVYTSGIYKGENKIWARIRRNIPAYRVYDRLNRMTKNNSYYRLYDSSITIKGAKSIVRPDEE